MELTPKQKEAVQSWGRGDVCVVAGPGSGKTTVLVERIRWLVEKKKVEPAEILAITFTEKAATQMYERLIEKSHDSSVRRAYEYAHISTIHAFCARLLREGALEAGFDPAFGVLEAWEADLELRASIARVLDEIYADDPLGTRRFLEAFTGSGAMAQGADLTRVHAHLFELYQSMRAWGGAPSVESIDPHLTSSAFLGDLERLAAAAGDPSLHERVTEGRNRESDLGLDDLEWLKRCGAALQPYRVSGKHRDLVDRLKNVRLPQCHAALLGALHAAPRGWLLDVTRRIDRDYRQRKRSLGSLDFADLEEYAVQVLEQGTRSPAFRHILIDEYQDTNRLQARLVRLLQAARKGSPPVLFAVGDMNQSIYGFRHADPDVFRQFRREVQEGRGHLVQLPDNFRSRPEILEVAETLFARPGGVESSRLVARKEFSPKQMPSVEVLIARAEIGDQAHLLETRHVAARLIQLRDVLRREGTLLPADWRDFAILLRSRPLIERFASGLREVGIPYQLSAGQGFFQAAEVRDLIRFLQVLRNPLDEVSLAAVLCSPLVGISDETLFRLRLAGGSRNLAQSVRRLSPADGEDGERWGIFQQRFERLYGFRDQTPPDILLDRLIAESGYEAYWQAQPHGQARAANIAKFVRLIRRLSNGGARPLDEVVKRLERLQATGLKEQEAPVLEESVNAVHLMTLHAAKGLEFPVVFLPALDSGPQRDQEALAFVPDRGLGARWIDPTTGDEAGDPVFAAAHEQRKRQQTDEADRLLYVGFTRAKQHIVLSASFGDRPTARNWAKHLKEQLAVDFKQIDNEPRVKTVRGRQFRLLVTNESPSPAVPAKVASSEAGFISITPVPPGDQSDSAAAVTSVSLFAECPRRYYLSRYLGFAEPPPKTWKSSEDDTEIETDLADATELGLQVHAVLAGSLPPEKAQPEAVDLARCFHDSELGRRAARARHRQREQSVVFSIDGHILRGQIDLWFDDGQEQILLDYKTDQVSAAEIEERANAYALQLRLYAEAIGRATGRRPDSGILYFLRPGQPVEVPMDSASAEQARARVHEFFQAQASLRFPLQIGRHCLRCPHYRGLCPARLGDDTASRAAVQRHGEAGK